MSLCLGVKPLRRVDRAITGFETFRLAWNVFAE